MFNGVRDHGWCLWRDLLAQFWVRLIHMSDLARRTPAAVAAPRVPSIRVSKRGEASICVEARRQLECQRLLLHEAVVPGRLDRLLVQVHGLRRPAVDPREFRKHECVAVAIVLRTVLGPESQLPQLALEEPGELHLLA